MLRIFYSNRTERLLSAFVSDVTRWRAEVGPFEPLHVVVPNSNVETWLRFGLARRTGIAAHLDVRYLSPFVSDLARRSGFEVVDGRLLRGMLLAVLLDDVVETNPELRPVRDYINDSDTREGADVRRLQLASRLSRLFEEYAFSRPEMLAQWRERCVLGETPFAETERWERALWLELFGPNGRLTRRRESARTPGEVAAENVLPGELGRKLVASAAKLPGRIHVFGVSYVARVFQDIFAALGHLSDLHIYTLNPCREFWEDVEDGRVSRLLPRRGERLGSAALEEEDPFGLEAPGDTRALRLWGRPGRENIRLLNELTDGDFDSAFDDPLSDGPTLLRAVQQDILDRAEERTPPAKGAAEYVADGSIQFLECPGIRREAEVIAGEIWRLVKESEARGDRQPLRFNDIAVIVNTQEKEEYFTHLTAAFAELHQIPCNVVDRSFALSSRVAEAMELLLDLPLGNFTRAELLRVVTHPCVGGALDDVDVEEWPRWCEELGIAHGAGSEDHAATYIEGDLFNWDQGLRRIGLGACMSGPRSGDEEPVELGTGRYLPFDLPMSSTVSAARFSALVRSLIADARFARDARLTLPEWADFFGAMLTAYISAGEEDRRDVGRVRSLLAELADIDVDGARVGFSIAAALAKELVTGQSGGSGQYLADGVVLSTCQPMRALPFRVVFMAGMGEGRFPASDRRDPLDLRQARPRAGDVNPRQQDRYLFLETLMCARERLYVSWVSRDPLTGDPLEPSSVVSELETILRGYLDEEEHPRLRTSHPLRRYDPKLFPELFAKPSSPDSSDSSHNGGDQVNGSAPVVAPEARREAAALALRHCWTSATGSEASMEWEALVASLDEEHRERIREWLGVPSLSEVVPEEELPPTIDLSLPRLTRFLQSPVQGWAQVQLGMSDYEEDSDAAMLVEDEPFASDVFNTASFLESILVKAFVDGDTSSESLARRYDEANVLRTLASRAPVGVFGQADRAAHLSVLQIWADALLEAEPTCPQGMPLRLAVGRASEFGELDRLLPVVEFPNVPIQRNGETVHRTVRLHGTLLPLVELQSRRISLILDPRQGGSSPPDDIRLWRRRLRAVLEHALLCAAGISADHEVWTPSSGRKGSELNRVAIAPFSREDASAWLAGLISDLLSGPHAYQLPYEAVFLWRQKGMPLVDAVEAVLAKKADTASFHNRQPSRFAQLPPPPEEDCQRMVERRFGPIFARLREGK